MREPLAVAAEIKYWHDRHGVHDFVFYDDALLIDEIGYLTLRPEQVNAFFKLMELRYARKATILTTNLDYPDWYDLFKRKPLVDALLDRLRHHCITVRIDGPSLRVPEQPDQPAQGKPSKPEKT